MERIALYIIIAYLFLLLALGLLSSKLFRGTSKDYFVASHSIGPFLLLMSVFGTTMTAFALVGSTGKAFERGIGTYGLMASISGLIHAAIFFLVGIRLWSFGKKYGYVTQVQFFRARFANDGLGYLLFPILVLLVVPYLLIGIIGAGKTMLPVTQGMFPEIFANTSAPFAGAVPEWLTGLIVCLVVLAYVFAGGSRGAAWANTFQTLVFMVMGVVAFYFISDALGGMNKAADVTPSFTENGEVVQQYKFDVDAHEMVRLEEPKVIGHVKEGQDFEPGAHALLQRTPVTVELNEVNPSTKEVTTFEREYGFSIWMFLTYAFIPLSVGMFPHLFQHWLTARSAKSFRLAVIAHPVCIMIVWVPCVLIGVWATGILPPLGPDKVAGVLGRMVNMLVGSDVLTGFLTAGILAAIMSSLDSQFLCLGTMFTNDIVLHTEKRRAMFSDKQVILIARSFIVVIVTVTYLLHFVAPKNVFDLAIWCFTGFSSLFPIVFAALYWRRATAAGIYASIIAAVITLLYFFYKSGYGGEYVVGDGVMPAAICVLVSALALVVVSLFTKPPSEAVIERFFGSSKKSAAPAGNPEPARP